MAKKKDTPNTDSGKLVILPAEENTVTALTVEKRAEGEIAKFEFPKQEIVKLKKKYASLSINGIDDKKGYAAMDEARKDLKAKRVAIEKTRATVKADYLEVGRKIDSFAGDLKTLVIDGDGGEQDLISKLAKIDEEKAKIERERQEAEQNKINQRIQKLENAGLSFNGRFYVIGNTISVDLLTLRDLSDEAIEVLTVNVSNEKARLDKEAEDARLLEEQRVADIEAERVENQKTSDALAAREKALKEKEDALIEKRTLQRKKLFADLGFALNAVTNVFEINNPSGSVKVAMSDLMTEDDELWDHRTEVMQVAIREINQAEEVRLADLKESEELANQIKNKNIMRFSKVVALGFVHKEENKIFIYSHDEWSESYSLYESDIESWADSDVVDQLNFTKSKIEEFKKEQELIISNREAEKEADRVASLSDSDKCSEFLVLLTDFMVKNQPELESTEFNSAYDYMWTGIKDSQRELNELILKLKK